VRTGGDVAVGGPSEQVTVYTDEEWQALGLATWTTTADVPQQVLGLVDWVSGSSTFVSLDVPGSIGGLGWVGEGP
jgi:hypothetical protein